MGIDASRSGGRAAAGRGAGPAASDARPCPRRGVEPYPPIEHHASLSDGQSAVLLAPDGAVTWMCAPRFDAGSVFAALLDAADGGAFRLDVDGVVSAERRYLDGTLALETRFQSRDATLVVTDFLALAADEATGELVPGGVLVRLLRSDGGALDVRAEIGVRPDYARRRVSWHAEDGQLTAEVPGTRLWLSSDLETSLEGEDVGAAGALRSGEERALALRYGGEPGPPVGAHAARRLLDATVRSWRGWSGRSLYGGFAHDLVARSALVLKGLVHQRTGAVLAAPTTSLPEVIGGERNWDYRYTWLRDSSLTLLALFRLGYEREGHDFMRFLVEACAHCGERLQLMLGIGHELELPEQQLDHLEGYARSRPVRVGNDAHGQVQLDTYGGVLDAALVYHQLTEQLDADQWPFLRSLSTARARTGTSPTTACGRCADHAATSPTRR